MELQVVSNQGPLTALSTHAMYLQFTKIRRRLEISDTITPEDLAMPVSELDTAHAKQILRDVGLRATAARVAVIKLLASQASPITHAEVVESLAEFGFDQSTLFRCLNEMADAEILIRLDLGDQTRRFEFRDSSTREEFTHPHFMCVDCGQLSCMNDFSIQITPSRGRRRKQLGTITEIMIRGHCGNCELQT